MWYSGVTLLDVMCDVVWVSVMYDVVWLCDVRYDVAGCGAR